jgi:deoxyribonucleoside regulator
MLTLSCRSGARVRDADSSLLVRIAHLYYVNDLRQSDIAKSLGISRQSVGRSLKRAKDLKLVQIRIASPLPTMPDLERALEEAFGLKQAIVCRPIATSDESIKEALGSVASDFLVRHVRDGQIIGISWGSTMLRLVSEMPKLDVKGVIVVQLDGSTDQTPLPTSAEYIVHRLADSLNAEAFTVPAPLIVDTRKLKERLISDSRISRALALIRRADLTLVGIGDVSSESNLYKTGYLDNTLIARLRAAEAVGDICGHFYNIKGRTCLPSLSARTIAIDLCELQTRPTSVAVAGGAGKADAIFGALAGKLCNVLITDETAAAVVLSKAAAHGRTFKIKH